MLFGGLNVIKNNCLFGKQNRFLLLIYFWNRLSFHKTPVLVQHVIQFVFQYCARLVQPTPWFSMENSWWCSFNVISLNSRHLPWLMFAQKWYQNSAWSKVRNKHRYLLQLIKSLSGFCVFSVSRKMQKSSGEQKKENHILCTIALNGKNFFFFSYNNEKNVLCIMRVKNCVTNYQIIAKFMMKSFLKLCLQCRVNVCQTVIITDGWINELTNPLQQFFSRELREKRFLRGIWNFEMDALGF